MSPAIPPAMEIVEVQSVRFDQARADELVQKLGSAIVGSSDFQEEAWTDLVVVAELDGGKSMFGYMFWEPNKWKGAIPDGFAPLRFAAELKEAMRAPGSDPWKKCRIRITRATGKIDIDFDYDGDKWIPKMSDPAGFAFSLRS